MFERVKQVICDTCSIPEEEIKMEATLAGDLDINSFELVNLIIAFEEEFDIEVDDDKVMDFTTVGDIVDYLEKEGKEGCFLGA